MEKVEAGELLRKATARLYAEAPARKGDQERLEAQVVEALRMRGLSEEALQEVMGLPDPGAIAIWSKSYTETHASRLLLEDGTPILEITTPLTHGEEELINKLGLRVEY